MVGMAFAEKLGFQINMRNRTSNAHVVSSAMYIFPLRAVASDSLAPLTARLASCLFLLCIDARMAAPDRLARTFG
jgi:hypothetical protein